jgi:hypothetical protein
MHVCYRRRVYAAPGQSRVQFFHGRLVSLLPWSSSQHRMSRPQATVCKNLHFRPIPRVVPMCDKDGRIICSGFCGVSLLISTYGHHITVVSDLHISMSVLWMLGSNRKMILYGKRSVPSATSQKRDR